MKNIQEFIEWVKDEQGKAYLNSSFFTNQPNTKNFENNGKVDAFSDVLQKLNLLLANDTGASTEAAILQTPCKANVPPEAGTTNSGVLAAASSATRLVRQNEQAVKVCPCCERILQTTCECGFQYD